MGEFRERRLEFLGIYHSHPNWMDANEPPSKDIALAYYSEAFSIQDGRATELENSGSTLT